MTWWTLLWIQCVIQRPQNTGSVASLQHSRGRNIWMNRRTWRNSIDVVFDGFKLDRWSHWALSVTTQTPAWSRTQVWERRSCASNQKLSQIASLCLRTQFLGSRFNRVPQLSAAISLSVWRDESYYSLSWIIHICLCLPLHRLIFVYWTKIHFHLLFVVALTNK